jgi:hypothetical protein
MRGMHETVTKKVRGIINWFGAYWERKSNAPTTPDEAPNRLQA